MAAEEAVEPVAVFEAEVLEVPEPLVEAAGVAVGVGDTVTAGRGVFLGVTAGAAGDNALKGAVKKPQICCRRLGCLVCLEEEFEY